MLWLAPSPRRRNDNMNTGPKFRIGQVVAWQRWPEWFWNEKFIKIRSMASDCGIWTYGYSDGNGARPKIYASDLRALAEDER